MATVGKRLVVGLIGAVLIVLMGFLALSRWDTYQPIFGGPKLAQLPDLVVDSIEYVGAGAPSSPCIGVNTAMFDVTVIVRNVGIASATLPVWGTWLRVWSVLGGTSPPFNVSVSGAPAQIAAGQTATFKTKVAGMAKVNTPEAPQSALTLAVIVDPDKAIPESNEDNNFKNKESIYGLELCPAPK
jgi:hypothetical protein